MSPRICASALVLILCASCSSQQEEDARDIVYPRSLLAETSHPAIVSAIRPFRSRVRPEDPKRVAIHFATIYGPGKGRGIWGEPVYWKSTFNSLIVKVKTPAGETFEIPLRPKDLDGPEEKRERRIQDIWWGNRLSLGREPTVFIGLPGTTKGFGDQVSSLTWPEKLDLSIEGTYHISVSGRIYFQHEDVEDISFTTAETSIEVTTEGLATTHDVLVAVRSNGNRVVKPRSEKEERAFEIKVEHWQGIEDVDGNRLFRHRAGSAGPWSYKQATIVVRPDGKFEGIAYRTIGTCIAEGSLVETEQGPLPIERLTVGMKVWGFDLEQSKKVLTTLRDIRTHRSHQALRFPSGLNVTPNHPVWTTTSWKQAGDLQPEDMLRRFDGSLVAAGKLEVVDAWVNVYDLTVDEPHNFFADGVLVHNKKRLYSPYQDDPWYKTWPQHERPADPEQAEKANRVAKAGGEFTPLDDGTFGIYFKRSKVTSADLEAIAGLKHIKSISMWLEARVGEEFVRSLSGFKELERLSIRKCWLTDDSLEHLQDLPRLTDLNIPVTWMSERGFRHLGQLTRLKGLYIDGIPDRASAEHLKSLQNLESLHLDGDTIKDEYLEVLESFPRLKLLYLRSNSIRGSGLAHLASLKNLEQLKISSCANISVESFQVLKRMQNLTLLEVNFSGNGGWCEVLADSTTLKSLYLSYSSITSEDVKHIGKMKQLKQLGLVESKISDDDLHHLYDLKELKSLWLPKQITDNGLKKLQEKLPGCKIDRS